MDAQFGGSVAERNVRSGAWMHSLEEVCRKGRPGVGAWMQSSCGKSNTRKKEVSSIYAAHAHYHFFRDKVIVAYETS